MKKILLTCLLALLGLTQVQAEEGGFPLDKAPDKINDVVDLQHGAQIFVN